MSQKEGIEKRIEEEIQRIAADVIEWEQLQEPIAAPRLRWKPRFDRKHFAREGDKRLVPTDKQVYYDLQLSRGAARPEGPDLAWVFDSPEERGMISADVNAQRLDHLTRFFPLSPETRVLELGVRSGHFLHYLLSRGYKNVAGVDCVRLNALWCQKNGLDVTEADAHELSDHFLPGSQDLILGYHVLEHCYDPLKVLAECRGVLNPSGGLHLEVPIGRVNPNTAHCYGFDRGELRRMLRSQAFDVIDYWQGSGVERVVAEKRERLSRSLVRTCWMWLQRMYGR